MKFKNMARVTLSLVSGLVALSAALMFAQPAIAATQATPTVTATSSSTTSGAVNLSWTASTNAPTELLGYDVRYATSSGMTGSTTIASASGAGTNTT